LKASSRRFGFDLDNTLIDYSNSVREYCDLNNLEECKTTNDLRLLLRASDTSGRRWQEAQSWLYTEGLNFAHPGFGAVELCEYLRSNEFELKIVSHKTTHTPDFCGGKPLREAASKWVANGELSIYFQDTKKIYFESSRALKISRIQSLDLNYFVDDLKAVFEEPNFPKEVTSFLLQDTVHELPWVQSISSLNELQEIIENEV
jgi:hypothetical protein